MPAQTAALNTDTNTKLTSGYYADRGDGTDNWHNVTRIYDGGHTTIGLKADAAVTNPAASATLIALVKGWLTGLGAIADSAVTDPTSSGSLVALLKGLLTFNRVSAAGVGKAEDAAHASGDTGIMALAVRKDTAAVSSGTTGDYEPLQTDSLGALRTVDAVAAKVGALSNATTTALAASLVVKASAGTLFGLQGYSTTAGFLLIHNTTSAPADTAVPVVSFPIESNKPFSLNLGDYGRAFATGITVVFSSTGPTKTIGGSVMWVDAQYI